LSVSNIDYNNKLFETQRAITSSWADRLYIQEDRLPVTGHTL